MPTKFIPLGRFNEASNNSKAIALDDATNVRSIGDGYRPMVQITQPDPGDFYNLYPIYQGAFDIAGYISARFGIYFVNSGTLYFYNSNTEAISSVGAIGANLSTQCSFTVFGNRLIIGGTTTPSYSDISNASANVSTLGGSPPAFRCCCTCKDFVIVGNTYESATYYTNRVWNSAINDSEGWTQGTNLCDYQDIPDIGEIVDLVGGEECIIIGTKKIAIMQLVGGDIGWEVNIICDSNSATSTFRNSARKIGNIVYYISSVGLCAFDGASSVVLTTGIIEPYKEAGFGCIAFDKAGNDVVFGWSSNWERYSLSQGTVIDPNYIEDREYYRYNIPTGKVTKISKISTGGVDYGILSIIDGYSSDQDDHPKYFIAKLDGNLKIDLSAGSRGVNWSESYGDWDSTNTISAEAIIKTNYIELEPDAVCTITKIRPVFEDVAAPAFTSGDFNVYTKPGGVTYNVPTTSNWNCRVTGKSFAIEIKNTGLNPAKAASITGFEITYTTRGKRWA